jgi:hypothetical protein
MNTDNSCIHVVSTDQDVTHAHHVAPLVDGFQRQSQQMSRQLTTKKPPATVVLEARNNGVVLEKEAAKPQDLNCFFLHDAHQSLLSLRPRTSLSPSYPSTTTIMSSRQAIRPARADIVHYPEFERRLAELDQAALQSKIKMDAPQLRRQVDRSIQATLLQEAETRHPNPRGRVEHYVSPKLRQTFPSH